jgi:hypothetical protein
LIGLSEESQVAYLQKKLEEYDGKAEYASIPVVGGGVLSGWYLMSLFMPGPSLQIFFPVVGVPLLTFGLIVTFYSRGQIKYAYRELETKFPNTLPICAYCKKTLQKQNPKFCVSCGKKARPYAKKWL